MSQEEILRNVYSFLQIIEASRNKDVEEWDVQALKNALKWAEWCEMLAVKACGKSYEQDLAAEVAKLNRLPWSLGNSQIDLDYLRDAKQQLIVSLLENPYLSSTLYSIFLENCLGLANSENQPIFLNTCAELAVKKVTTTIANDILTDVASEFEKSGSRKRDLHSETFALHLLNFVGDALERAEHSAKQRNAQLVNRKLRKILETSDKGLGLLLLCLHVNGDHFDSQTFILNFIKGYISSLPEYEKRRVFSSLDKRDLCVLAKNCWNILGIICEWLEYEGLLMAPCLDHGKLSWRSTDESGLDYKVLLDTARQLWLCDSKVASFLQEKLLMRPENAYCVWHSIKRLLFKDKSDDALQF